MNKADTAPLLTQAGPVHGLMSRPFAFPATFFMVIAKFITNAALVVVDHICTLFYSIPAYAAFPLAFAILFFTFRNSATARCLGSPALRPPQAVSDSPGAAAPASSVSIVRRLQL